VIPSLSLAHTDGVAIAVAGYCSNDKRLGIDIECIRQHEPGFDRFTFVSEEISLLSQLDEFARQEWVTRFWCAKEAVAKALGRGFLNGPRSLAVQEFNTQTKVIQVSIQGKLAEMFPEFNGSQILAYTAREEDYIIAISFCERV